MYIVIEGIIGVGKTSAAAGLFEWFNSKHPELRPLLTREPGGTQIAEAIRKLVQGTVFENDVMEPVTDAYLYAAARAQSLRKVVIPALSNHRTVISDRTFLTSMANQGIVQGLGFDKILEINNIAIGSAWPSLVIQLVTDEILTLETAIARAFDAQGDKWEQLGVEFYKKVQETYKEMAELPMLRDIWRTVPASGSRIEVRDQIVAIVKSFFHISD